SQAASRRSRCMPPRGTRTLTSFWWRKSPDQGYTPPEARQGDTHTDELLVAYIPGPGILVEADSYSPGPPNTPAPSPAPPNAVSLYENIQRLKLNVRTIAPIHGRGAVPFAEFRKFIGK